MPSYVLAHRHTAEECRPAFAAWNGFASPLRHGLALSSCTSGGHRLFWTVDAPDAAAARALLPPFIAERTEITEVREVRIP